MIILRKKISLKELLFGLRSEQGNDPLPNPLFLPDKNLVDQYGFKLDIQNSKKYDKDQQKLDSVSKSRVKELRKSITHKGNYYDDGDIEDADTHYLSKLSKNPKESHLVSKYINGKDRLNYRIYKPQLVEDLDTGEIKYLQKIVFESCYGHDTNGQGTY